ncbi:DUF7266 family protein [Halosimplex marinum]|uniref:DUF7266 family protein n=1 Tax=Halosimplex marinum TaxID=3396620 RepID=UPI003F5438A2
MGSPPPRPRRRPGSGDDGLHDGSPDDGGLPSANRGQSTALEYTLALAVASLVITGLLVTAGDFVTQQRSEVVRTELGVVGQQLAGDVVAADRLARAGASTETVAVNASLPGTVAGAGYNIEVADTGSGQWLNLSTADPSVSVSVRFETDTAVATGSVSGGDVSVVYDEGEPGDPDEPDDPHLEVRG